LIVRDSFQNERPHNTLTEFQKKKSFFKASECFVAKKSDKVVNYQPVHRNMTVSVRLSILCGFPILVDEFVIELMVFLRTLNKFFIHRTILKQRWLIWCKCFRDRNWV